MIYPDYKYIKISEENKVTTVFLNRPDLHNAFNEDMISEVTDMFKKINETSSRIVVIKGEGKSFCAGADLNWMKKMKDYT
ncbi:MAG: enoyl-CoA hydratase-related protein, partial [Proteobacteria bacterium]|nr:enoyl-CoA hydratase-related protein [Pseudomonadota bacterium]